MLSVNSSFVNILSVPSPFQILSLPGPFSLDVTNSPVRQKSSPAFESDSDFSSTGKSSISKKLEFFSCYAQFKL